MRVRTHLISMPWSHPERPSIQLGCLKGHLDRALQPRSDCRAYSAFLSILHDFKGRTFREFFRVGEFYGEHAYQALYLHRFGPRALRGRRAIERVLAALRAARESPLSLSALEGLERATRRFLDRDVGPNLIARALNLVGFTVNYRQLYSSLYAAEHLRRRFPGHRFLFVYGGGSVSLPNVYRVLTELGVPGVVVVGEGERKLELLVRTLRGLPQSRARTALQEVARLDPGIIVIGEKVDLTSRDPAHHASQMETLNDLAQPDYADYFAALRRACADEATYRAFCADSEVLVEGSRGCTARCDFCALNRSWSGFRKRSADRVVRDTVELSRKYGTSRIMFVDSLCDGWAAEYARMLVQAGIHQRSFMELRASHPESFWTLLALGGVRSVQVGVESLSAPLLKAIGKGTSVVQNLATQKYLAELGIWPSNHLITHHPASTLADVTETGRILDQIPHWGPFLPSRFALMAGSPLYDGLSREERTELEPIQRFRLPPGAARFAVEYSFQLPKSLRLARDVTRAWSAFERRYRRRQARHEVQKPRLDVVRVGRDALRIADTRDGKMLFHELSGAAARIYDGCHRPLKVKAIVEITGLSPRTVEAHLARLVRSRLVLPVGDVYLSLALRPRDELVQRFLATEVGTWPRPQLPTEPETNGRATPGTPALDEALAR
jgi:radical SAM superfamily enzyme YgiQ (UPF0313 family)